MERGDFAVTGHFHPATCTGTQQSGGPGAAGQRGLVVVGAGLTVVVGAGGRRVVVVVGRGRSVTGDEEGDVEAGGAAPGGGVVAGSTQGGRVSGRGAGDASTLTVMTWAPATRQRTSQRARP